MWIKFTRDTSYGKKGNVIQMNNGDAASWIRSGMAVESGPPERGAPNGESEAAAKKLKATRISNKSLSAAG